jgi:hypothetical protein
MIKKTDSPAMRSVEVAIDVPGTPKEVWRAIATGPGFTAWFVPTRIEERGGGAVAFEMAPGMESKGIVKVWEPPPPLRGRGEGVDAGRSAYRNGDPRRGALGRDVHRASRDQTLHQQRRLGRPARERGEGLADVPPHPAPVPHALRGPALRARDGDRPLAVEDCGAGAQPMVNLYMYGDPGPAAVARNEPAWRGWMEQRFPAPATTGAGATTA